VTLPPLAPSELALVRRVFRRHPEISSVRIFGSRAKGTHTPRSDVDLALWGDVDPLRAEAIAAELDELPLPYRFDVQAFESIRFQPLREHIERVGVVVYEKTPSADQGADARALIPPDRRRT
jgi:predicted nucleotidyltransferase